MTTFYTTRDSNGVIAAYTVDEVTSEILSGAEEWVQFDAESAEQAISQHEAKHDEWVDFGLISP